MKIKKNCVAARIMFVYTTIRSNTKYLMGKKDESHFVFLIYTLRVVATPPVGIPRQERCLVGSVLKKLTLQSSPVNIEGFGCGRDVAVAV